MLVMPKVNSASTLDMISMIRTNSTRKIDITFKDDEGNPVNIDESMSSSGEPSGELDLEVTDINGRVLYSESYWPKPIPDDRRIVNSSTGKYSIKWGTESNETDNTGTLLFNWHIRQNANSEDFYRTQVVECISPRTLSLLPRFRLQLDKSLKVIVPEEFCTLGYSDAQLVIYMQSGLSRINSAQPYPMWQTLDQYPMIHHEILLQSSMLTAILSQGLFAVDTDVPAYNDQGHSFVVSHASQLKSYYDSLAPEVDRRIQALKLRYVCSGTAAVEMRIGYAFFQMLATSPPGSLFRNVYTNI